MTDDEELAKKYEGLKAVVDNSVIVRASDVRKLIEERDQLRVTLKLANAFVADVMPQIGKLAIQDYAGLNDLCIRLKSEFG